MTDIIEPVSSGYNDLDPLRFAIAEQTLLLAAIANAVGVEGGLVARIEGRARATLDRFQEQAQERLAATIVQLHDDDCCLTEVDSRGYGTFEGRSLTRYERPDVVAAWRAIPGRELP